MAGIAACALLAVAAYRSLYASSVEAIRGADAQRLEYFAESLEYALDKHEHLPVLIALERDVPDLLLYPGDPARVDAVDKYLMRVQSNAAVGVAYLVDKNGVTLASSNTLSPGSFVGEKYPYRPYFREAVAGKRGRFYGVGVTTGEPGYFLSTPVLTGGEVAGVVVVKVSLDRVEQAWRHSGERLLVVDENGVIILSSEPMWKYKALAPLSEEALKKIAQARQYGTHRLAPFDEHRPIRLADGAQTLPLAATGIFAKARRPSDEVLLQSRDSGPLGWRVVLLSDLTAARASARAGAAAAGFGAAFGLMALFYAGLRRGRLRERLAARAALERADQELERRIAERTAELLAGNRILRETQDSAVQAGKLAALGQMAAGITHELNQPLTALTMLQDNAAKFLGLGRLDEARDNLERGSQLTQRMGGILGQLKSFARKGPTAMGPVVVAEAIASAASLVEPQRRRARATLEVQQQDASLRALADSVRLEQVLVNLLRNGIEAQDGCENPRLVLMASREEGRIHVSVRDHGPGIPDEVRPHLFEPFFTTKPPGVGLGLGLALSRTIAQGMGGEILAREAEGRGAEFVLTLPEA